MRDNKTFEDLIEGYWWLCFENVDSAVYGQVDRGWIFDRWDDAEANAYHAGSLAAGFVQVLREEFFEEMDCPDWSSAEAGEWEKKLEKAVKDGEMDCPLAHEWAEMYSREAGYPEEENSAPFWEAIIEYGAFDGYESMVMLEEQVNNRIFWPTVDAALKDICEELKEYAR